MFIKFFVIQLRRSFDCGVFSRAAFIRRRQVINYGNIAKELWNLSLDSQSTVNQAQQQHDVSIEQVIAFSKLVWKKKRNYDMKIKTALSNLHQNGDR